MKRKTAIMAFCLMILIPLIMVIMVGCENRQANVVSYNLSLEADNFNVTRQLTVINQRTDTVIFQMIGNFSINKATDGDLEVIGEDDNGRFYKHFICLSSEIAYVVEDLGGNSINKHKYSINFNPEMIIPLEVKTID